LNDAPSVLFSDPGRAQRGPGSSAADQELANESCLMCDECEEIEPLTVAYYGKMERRGWRPPAAAGTEPILDDRLVSGRPYAIAAPRFVCEPAGSREVD